MDIIADTASSAGRGRAAHTAGWGKATEVVGYGRAAATVGNGRGGKTEIVDIRQLAVVTLSTGVPIALLPRIREHPPEPYLPIFLELPLP